MNYRHKILSKILANWIKQNIKTVILNEIYPKNATFYLGWKLPLLKGLREDKSHHLEQVGSMSDIARENWSLQNATEYVQFQVAVTKTSFLTH